MTDNAGEATGTSKVSYTRSESSERVEIIHFLSITDKFSAPGLNISIRELPMVLNY